MFQRAFFILSLAALLAACGGTPATQAPGTQAPGVQNTAPAARTAAATFTAAPTNTAVPATPTTAPTVTPTPDPTADLCPLTGLKDTARPWTTRRPLAIKIDNSPPARPQSALLQADVVFEHLAEGGISRFDAVFWCATSTKIGPVRSARIIDFDLVAMLQAALVHIGASNENLARLRETFGNRLLDGDVEENKPLFHRSTDRVRPYNTYVSTSEMWELANKFGSNATNIKLKGLSFSDDAPAGGKPGTHVDVPLDARFSLTSWDYVAAQKKYSKSLFGTPFLSDNQRMQDENVVILFAKHTVTNIVEDSLGSRSIQIDLHGRGRAVVFRDGKAIEGQWVREPDAMLRLVDASGQDIPLKTGHTWFEIVPSEMNLAYR